jgi:glutaredoxin
MGLFSFVLAIDTSMLILYKKQNCPKCDQLKKVLEAKGVLFSEVDLSADPVAMDEFRKAHPFVKSVPFIAGDFVHFR